MGKFGDMITFAVADYQKVGAGNKICTVVSPNVHSVIDNTAVTTGFLKGVLDKDGKALIVPNCSTANNDCAEDKFLEKHCGRACSTLPGYKYYKAELCATKETCCTGVEFSDSTTAGTINPSCKLISGGGTITLSSTNGRCYKRAHATVNSDKSINWHKAALLSMNDTTSAACSSACGDRVKAASGA